MTEIEQALKNKTSPYAARVARLEKVSAGFIKKGLAEGSIVIPRNKKRNIRMPCAIGSGLRTKINANIGTSGDKINLKQELKKLDVSVACGADTVMDLSVGGDIAKVRRAVIKRSPVPVGTVPIYEAAVNAARAKGTFLKMSSADMFAAIEAQAEDGVDFMTVHCGVTRRTVDTLRKGSRLLGIVSRGGAMLASWIKHNKAENPLFEDFDRLIDIAYHYDITLSLGDGLRPGSILDATDSAQISELKLLGALARRARRRKVQVIIEGPGHVPLNQIRKNIELQKKFCDNSPFYVLGPLVTDVASTRDHIAGAIGGALAASYGADFLCVVSAAEHLRHPSVEDVKEGVIASRIAAHSADIAKGVKGAADWDKEMSLARKKRDWKRQIALSIDPGRAKEYRAASRPNLPDVCTMCGEYCSIKLMEECS